MSKTAIPSKVANALWAKAAGRCQFRGCNKLLIGDLIAGKRTGKFGYIAHIVADEAGGPRVMPSGPPCLPKTSTT